MDPSGIPWQNTTKPFLHTQEEVIYTLVRISSGLSAIGSLFILITWFLFSDLHFFSRKLIVYISITDLASSITFFYGTFLNGYQEGTSPTTGCIVQGMLIQFFYLASYMWTGCLAMHLYQILIKKVDNAEQFEKWYHLFAWGLPLSICGYLLYRELHGASILGGADRAWCWIADHSSRNLTWEEKGVFEQFLCFYVPQVLVFAFNASLYSILIRQVKGSQLGDKIRKRLLWYLLAFLFVAVWGLIHRVYQVFIPDHKPSYVLSIAESFFGPLQGFLNCIVYGLSKKIAARYCKLWVQQGTAQESYYSSHASSNNGSFVMNEESHDGDACMERGSSFRASPPMLVDTQHPQYHALLNAAVGGGEYGHYSPSPTRQQPIIAPVPRRQLEDI